MTVERRKSKEGLTFELQGTFDAAAADELIAQLRETEQGRTPVTVDFREVRVLHDSAVARLALELRRAVRLLGLSEHHHRLLRYVGLAAPEAPPAWRDVG